jgi:hypothetical protein
LIKKGDSTTPSAIIGRCRRASRDDDCLVNANSLKRAQSREQRSNTSGGHLPR